MKIQSLLLAVTLAAGVSLPVHAGKSDKEKDYEPYPHMFVGLHGGAQATFTNYKFGKLITPMYGVSFGGYFTPVVGARLHVGGLQTKGGIKSLDKTYDYKYAVSDVDLMLNITNLISNNPDRVFNWILLGGVGLNYAWDNDDFHALTAGDATYPLAWEDNRLGHNVRVGTMFDFNIAKHFGLNLEIAADNTSDRYNSKTSNSNDWSMHASLGLIFKFGQKKKKVQESEPVPVVEEWATRVDTIWYDDVTYKEVPVAEKHEEQIYFEIRKSEPVPANQVKAVADFVKAHKNSKVVVVGYADEETGTPSLNMRYSKERAEKVVAALVEAGVDKAVITAEWKGDTEQPFADNDKNRVAIVTVTGEGVKKEPVTTKKFRTEEKRYRVK